MSAPSAFEGYDALNGRPIDDLRQELQDRCNAGIATKTERLNARLLSADLEVVNWPPKRTDSGNDKTRIAIVSLLFNWPSTGGGIVHTAELAKFLAESGYNVRHLFASYEPWNVGAVNELLPHSVEVIEFHDSEWTPNSIRSRFRSAVRRFDPDCVIVTDSWNTKPLLAEAVFEYPYFVRLAAMECVCPLNNVRLIPDATGRPQQCHLTQFAARDACVECVSRNVKATGGLHIAERQLAQFAESDYDKRLRETFRNAAAVLVVNSRIASLVEPYAQKVCVIPSGFDISRFEGLPRRPLHATPFRILFAGLVEEYMKGFHVLLDACQQLWAVRHDFEVWVTAQQADLTEPFLRFIGWQSQSELPRRIAECDVVAVPTVAQEALGRTAVESMAAGRAVIASRLGGLAETVCDGFTGLLVEPADSADLARGLVSLMDDRELTARLGESGRKHFLATYPWKVIIERKYKPLFEACRRRT